MQVSVATSLSIGTAAALALAVWRRRAASAALNANIIKAPTTGDELWYQKAEGFHSAISIGGPAPDGAALKLDGTPTTLLAALNSERPTILNFGSCT